MERQRQGQTVAIITLAVAIMVMAVGFAAATYGQTLNLNASTATVKSSKWSVHFDNTYVETEGSVEATSKSVSDTSMDFTVTLSNPGDFYEFTTKVINDGTFDATLNKVTMSALTAEQAKYLTYTIYVGETSYTATSAEGIGKLLEKATGVHPVKVRVEYVMPTDSDDLPQQDATVTLTASLDYVSVD